MATEAPTLPAVFPSNVLHRPQLQSLQQSNQAAAANLPPTPSRTEIKTLFIEAISLVNKIINNGEDASDTGWTCASVSACMCIWGPPPAALAPGDRSAPRHAPPGWCVLTLAAALGPTDPPHCQGKPGRREGMSGDFLLPLVQESPCRGHQRGLRSRCLVSWRLLQPGVRHKTWAGTIRFLHSGP